MATYNGHKNYTYWNVSLWLNNDEGLYNEMKHCIRATRNRTEAARMMMESLPDKTPDGARYSLSAIKAAMIGL